jgi:hypothetical protein
MKTFLLPCVAAFLLGACLAGVAGWLWVAEAMKSSIELLMLHEISWEMTEASEGAKANQPCAAIALEHAIRSIQRLESQGFRPREAGVDEGLAYVRLGIVREGEGDLARADDAYSRGRQSIKAAGGGDLSVDELKRIVGSMP